MPGPHDPTELPLTDKLTINISVEKFYKSVETHAWRCSVVTLFFAVATLRMFPSSEAALTSPEIDPRSIERRDHSDDHESFDRFASYHSKLSTGSTPTENKY